MLRANENISTSADQRFADVQYALAQFNHRRLEPSLGEADSDGDVEHELIEREGAFVESLRADVAALLTGVPAEPEAFVTWFERLRISGPGQGDPLFPWLAEQASYAEMRWFLTQEVAGEAGFDDLVALTQIKMPERAKLEMAR